MAKETSFSLRSLLKKEKRKRTDPISPIGSVPSLSYSDTRKEYFLKTPVPEQPKIDTTGEDVTKYTK